jgi:Ca2+-binding RTX toxin-like protein
MAKVITITLTDKNDKKTGNSGNEKIIANGGNDTIDGGAGKDTLDGGNGDDNLTGGKGNDVLLGGAGSDTAVYAGALQGKNGERLYTFDFDANGRLVVTDLSKKEGVDTLEAIEYLQFKDLLVAVADLPKVNSGQQPIYTLTSNASSADEGSTVTYTLATVGILAGTDLAYTITGISDADLAKGSAPLSGKLVVGLTDSVTLKLATDAITEGPEIATLALNNGKASASTTVNDTSLTPTPTQNAGIPEDTRTYDLTLPLTENADSLTGSAKNDKILGLGGADTLNGGTGNDYLDGGDGNDVLTGGDGNDFFDGGNGNDLLSGGKGDDYLFGGAGNDTIASDEGYDSIDGGAGDDTLSIGSYYYHNDGIYYDSMHATIHGGAGNDYIYSDPQTEVSWPYGSPFKYSNPQLYGDDGDDYLNGGGELYGGLGNDTLVGKKTHMIYYQSNPTLEGGMGIDTLSTKDGNAVFRYTQTTDSGIGAGNRDIITDFDSESGDGQWDVIDLGQLSNTPLNFISVSPFSGKAGEVNYSLDLTNQLTIVAVDLNGDAAADMEIQLTGIQFLFPENFILSLPPS